MTGEEGGGGGVGGRAPPGVGGVGGGGEEGFLKGGLLPRLVIGPVLLGGALPGLPPSLPPPPFPDGGATATLAVVGFVALCSFPS